jgi:formylglycine-generating enzyme required for sulfatase activity
LVQGYSKIYQILEGQGLSSWIPDLMLQFAESLEALADKSLARQQAKESFMSWLKLRNLQDLSTAEYRKSLKTILTTADNPYLEKLQAFLGKYPSSDRDWQQAKDLLDAWQFLQELDLIAEPPIVEVDGDLVLASEAQLKTTTTPDVAGEKVSFEVVNVNSKGEIINREIKTNIQQTIDLGNGIKLEMMYIPAGEFMMGAREGEEGEISEYPQHLVRLSAFYMSKYPVTQEQYRAITGSNPAKFKGDKRPVESVNWHQAKEFCQKLSGKTGKSFNLPSEAQWEYACRAGTTTPFYFGETITTDLANYDGSNIYDDAPEGRYIEQTISVGIFPPNAFGLCDMHGNVLEWCEDTWCEDTWHRNYNDAPDDGSAWINTNYHFHILRGGSWRSHPWSCRAASRGQNNANDVNGRNGFRLILVP